MKEFTFSEARQQFATVLDQARKHGAVRIRRRDGQLFVLRPETQVESPLDVEGIKLDLSEDEIARAIHEGRRVF
jgi:hypothetical protein